MMMLQVQIMLRKGGKGGMGVRSVQVIGSDDNKSDDDDDEDINLTVFRLPVTAAWASSSS